MKTEQTECCETSAYKIQTPGNYAEEGIQYSEHDENLKSNINLAHKYLHISCEMFQSPPLFVPPAGVTI